MRASIQSLCAYCGAESGVARYCCRGCESLDGSVKSLDQESSQYSYLDLENIKSTYRLTSGVFHYRLHVAGLHCASCVHLIERLPEFDSQIKEARVDFATSSLAIRTEPDFSLAHLIDLLNSWGYGAHFLNVDEGSFEKAKHENKLLLKKLAVTGACAGNIMLFVVPIYAGLDGSWKTLFNWVSFFLFLPVVLYSGTPFYRGAWNSLRYRVINVDLPITVALLSSFFLSTVNLVRDEGAVYFDSTAGFIFLILCARYYLKRSQQNFLTDKPLENIMIHDQFRVIERSGEKILSVKEIKIGDILRLRQGQTAPVDGVLQSAGLIDLAVMNGEPLPRRFESGMKILAGSKILSGHLDILVTAPYDSTYLSALLQELRTHRFTKSNFISMTDKAAQWLILTVTSLAGLYFAFNFQYDFQEAFDRALALVVLACPCALAFGAPLTLNLALRKAHELGILIKEGAALEKLWSIQNVFFDKTGTLTSLSLKLVRTQPQNLSAETRSLIVSLETKSYHPIAFAIRDHWPNEEKLVIENLFETPGVGVGGAYNNAHYELLQNYDNSATSEISVALNKDGQKICSLFFESPLDPKAKDIVEQLCKWKLDCHLVSGDHRAKAQAVGERCGIASQRVYGGLTPQGKRDLVMASSHSCMIGDGSNDALALQAATVGIAVKGSTYVNLQAADVYFTREGLQPLLDLFGLARQTKKVLIRNLSFALIYNLIGGTLALMGHVDPWLAAVLMPASSALIITSTLWGFR